MALSFLCPASTCRVNVIQNAIIDGSPLAFYDADRREELARRALDALQILPQGESRSQAFGRLKTLDSVERHIRQEMARKKVAADAAARYGRE